MQRTVKLYSPHWECKKDKRSTLQNCVLRTRGRGHRPFHQLVLLGVKNSLFSALVCTWTSHADPFDALRDAQKDAAIPQLITNFVRLSLRLSLSSFSWNLVSPSPSERLYRMLLSRPNHLPVWETSLEDIRWKNKKKVCYAGHALATYRLPLPRRMGSGRSAVRP